MLGILLANHLAIHHSSLNILLFISFLSLVYFRQKLQTYSKRWVAGLAINFFLFLLGYQLTYYQNDLHDAQHFKQSIAEENLIIGIINKVPSEKNGRIKVELTTQATGTTPQNIKPCNGKIVAYLKNEPAAALKYGDQLLIKSTIRPIQSIKNPDAFDFKNYLHFQNIHFQLFAGPKKWHIISENKGNPLWQIVYQTRNHYLAVLEKYIPSEEELAIAAALILGSKDKLNKNLKTAYSESGAIHVLAVSGLHVGIISSFLLFLLQLLPYKNRVWQWIKLGLVLTCIWLFAFLTGLSPSVQRAAILFSALNIGWTLQRDVNIYNALAIAAFFILVTAPYALFDVGFQFSFLAVIGIVFFAPKFIAFWVPKNVILYNAWQLTIVGISAQLAVFPLVLYYFHQVPTYFWLSGLFVIPFAGILMKLGILLLLTHGFSGLLSSIIGALLTNLISLQNFLIHAIQELPFSTFSGFWISQFEVMLFYGIILSIAMLLLTYRFRWLMGIATCLLLVSCVQFNTKYQQNYQQKIVVYSVLHNSVIDFIDGQTTYTLGGNSLSKNQQTYTLKNNRLAKGIKKITAIDEVNFDVDNLIKRGHLFQFNNIRIGLIDKQLPENTSDEHRFECDYLVLQNNPKITLAQLTKHYKFRALIFDGSNANWFIKKWKIICEDSNIRYRDIKNGGAYEINATEKSTTPYYQYDPISLNSNPKLDITMD